MNLLTTYNEIDKILNTLDFNALYTGFHKYKFAIYDSKEICLDGTVIPYEESFLDNTSKLYNGEYIAIWNIELDPIYDMDVLAYDLVHEMFHCHQNTNHEVRFPSDLSLLNYPNDIDNYSKKHGENVYLANAYENCDMEQFKKFVMIRNQRLDTYPDMVRHELKAETIEGLAEFVGLKALKIINREKFTSKVRSYMDELNAESTLLFDIRRISYFSGAVFFLCLEALGYEIKNDFNSSITVYEQNPVSTEGITVDVSTYDFIVQKYSELFEEREAIVAKHIARSQHVECGASICGYDPMNMFRIGNLIYCNHFVFLNEDDQINNISGAVVLELAYDSDYAVKGYYKLSGA